MRAFLSAYAGEHLGSPIRTVRFRAGRIDAVWGVELDDGRAVVIKGHRTPAGPDTVGALDTIVAARDAQRYLAAAGFPCPEPLSGPDEIDGRVLTAETLLAGEVPAGRASATRRLLAEGLARHIDLLRARPGLREKAGPGPSWCRYQAGPWPVPHDPIVNFDVTPAGYDWLDEYARRASDQILTCREGAELVVGHADWYAGNTAVLDGVLVGTFDWELVADTEAVIAGFAAACYAASSTSGAGLSTPDEVAVFLQDYQAARGAGLYGRERRSACAAAAWIIAFNARWEVGMSGGKGEEGPNLTLAREHGQDYLDLIW
nr:phosphotransferase [Actinopolymorpha cephalotaxi]